MDTTPDQLQSIVEACNSEEIYKWLFKEESFLSLPSSHQMARLRGPLILRMRNSMEKKSVIGSIKIIQGLALNAVAAIKDIAKQAGYKRLFAQTKANNMRSENVLIKNDFIGDDNFRKNSSCQKGFGTIL